MPGCGGLSTADAVEAFITACRARGLRSKTVAWYLTILGALEVGDETRFDYWRGLRTFYRWCSARFGCPDAMGAVARPRRRRKAPRALTEGEVRRVMAAAMTRRDKALLARPRP